MSDPCRKRHVDILLDTKHYKQINLIIYLLSVVIILLVYYLTLSMFSKTINVVATASTSFLIGIFLIYNRNCLVKKINDIYQDYNRSKYKQNSKEGLKNTIKRITPKNKRLKLDIKGKLSIKEKAQKLKDRLKKDNNSNKKEDYIEIH